MPRETTISKVLLPLLDRYPSIDIPGLGNIRFHQLPAQLDQQSHVLFPPRRTLLFSTELTEENNIYDLLSDYLNKKGIKQFNTEVDFAINELINLGKTKLDGIATIVRQEDGSISLQDIEPAARGPLRYLPNVQLTPHTEVRGGLFATEELPKKIAPVVPPSPYQRQEVSKWKSYAGPLLFLLLAFALIAIVWKQCGSTFFNQKDTDAKTTAPIPSIATDSAVLAMDNEFLIKYDGILTEEIIAEGCVIVIGSFGSRVNASNRANDVTAMGYEGIVVDEEGRFRAAIRFDCGTEDLDDYMEDVRTKVESKAWFLSPPDYKSN